MTLDEERQLLQRIKEDPKYFGIFFDEYYKPIFNYIFRRVADYDISRDITAETFLKAFLNVQSFVWKEISISSWIYRIATNEINYFFRRQRNKPVSLDYLLQNDNFDNFDREEYQSEKDKLEKELELHSEFVKVRMSLTELDIKYQEVLSLRYFEKKSLKEIAEILDKKEGTIKSLLSRGTEKLKKLINSAT
jgi:RNA polymerase sigma-70 factor (ECF subfamily)